MYFTVILYNVPQIWKKKERLGIQSRFVTVVPKGEGGGKGEISEAKPRGA